MVSTTGVHEKIASKKSVSGAAEDLELALDEGITSPDAVLEAFDLSDRVRYLDPGQLWAFVVASAPWKESAALSSKPTERLLFVLELALEEEVVTLPDVFDGVTFDEITSCLPTDELQLALAHALRSGRRGAPLDESRFLEVVPLGALIGFLSAEHVWDRVVVERIAEPCGFVEVDPDAPKSERARKETPAAGTARAPEPPAVDETTAASFVEVDDAEVDLDVDVDLDEALSSSPSQVPYEDSTRTRVTSRLEGLGRLPPRHACLSLQNLYSLDSMYAEMREGMSDEEREAIIRDSFPNETALRSTMLALIELLDPTIDTHEPVIRDADVAALIKVVLFEERLRAEGARRNKATATSPGRPLSPPPSRPASPLPPPPTSRRAPLPSPAPPPSQAANTPPPPASRSSVPPPRHVIDSLPMLSLEELEEEVVAARRARAH